MSVLGVIPSRYKSVRFPGKPLTVLGDKTLVEHVYQRAKLSDRLTDIIIATDDNRIAEAVKKFNGEVSMTSPDHESGSDRVAEVVGRYQKEHPDIKVVVNIQGDEPLLQPSWIDAVVDVFRDDPGIQMTTCMRKITEAEDLLDKNVVKVVTDKNGNALYFSRAMIPYPKEKIDMSRLSELEEIFKFTVYYQHIGLYAYQPDFLQKMTAIPPSPLEMIEGLEQLRVLEAGYSIRVVEVEGRSIGIDVPEDVDKVLSYINDDLKENVPPHPS